METLSSQRRSSEAASGREEALLAEVERLHAELDRYQAHAQRTSKLFLSATNYAEWVRANARREAEVALRKAKARVDQLERSAQELERTERELVRARSELERLQTLADETRSRLFAFLTTGIEMLTSGGPEGQEERPTHVADEFQETLQQRVSSASVSLPESAS